MWWLVKNALGLLFVIILGEETRRDSIFVQPELFTEPVWGKGKTQEIGMNTVKRRSWQIDHL